VLGRVVWVEVACDVEASALLVEVTAWLVDVAAAYSAAGRRPPAASEV
jgi:hypothetical protein